VGDKHVRGAAEEHVVQGDVRIGIQALEHQEHLVRVQILLTEGERRAVDPVLVLKGLGSVLVHAVVRILQSAFPQQVHLNTAWDLCRQPLIRAGLTELPSRR